MMLRGIFTTKARSRNTTTHPSTKAGQLLALALSNHTHSRLHLHPQYSRIDHPATMSSKKKKGSPSKKSKDETNTSVTSSSSPTSPLRLLLRILPVWIAVMAVALKVYLGRKNAPKNNPRMTLFVILNNEFDEPDRRISKLHFLLCRHAAAYCHPDLAISQREFRATKDIPIGTKLFEIPRSMQLWDLDAYRDPFVRKHLFKASHKISGNRLSPEAFLAAYLALEMQRAEENPSSFDPLMLAYFESLPTWNELKAYHPTLQDKQLMNGLLGRSAAFSTWQGYRNMIHAEWEAFSATSSEFEQLVGNEGYLRARVLVLTRVFQVGPPGPEEVMPAHFVGSQLDNQDLLLDELYSYKDLIGVNLTAADEGCIAMIPLADQFNHHPNLNVGFNYKRIQSDNSGRSYVVSAVNRNIDVFSEPMASYGVMSDAHLYGRYGFNNGDGSGHIQLSIAFQHELMKLNMTNEQYQYIPRSGSTYTFKNYQKKGIIKYLYYDDGYDGCITGPMTHPEEAELKRLKLEHLLRIANEPEKWMMLMGPRNPRALPSISSHIPNNVTVPQFDRNFQYLQPDVYKLQETCRIMSLITSDYNGRAVDVLKENLGNSNFVIGPNVSDSLEFRSYMCVSRWFGTRVVTMELHGSLQDEFAKVSEMNQKEWGSFNWTAKHVRFGEMQASHAGSALLFAEVSKYWEDKKVNAEPEYRARDQPCPDEYAKFLLKEAEDELSSDFLYY
ncbi:MAG: hypothetical protein SGILL_006862 [Bacillariaceae sp.]